jgi:peptidoglycan hydrolase-like protein with peptidoglycan-binding domain
VDVLKKILLIMIVIIAILLTICGYIIVERRDPLPPAIQGLINRLGLCALAEAEVKAEAVAAPDFLPMANGARGEEVRAVQRRLIELGFMAANADGVFGPITEAGVIAARAFLFYMTHKPAAPPIDALAVRTEPDEKVELPSEDSMINVVDGEDIITSENLSDIVIAPEMPSYSGTVYAELYELLLGESGAWLFDDIAKGAMGPEVMRVQTRLNSLDYLYGGIDGIYGGITEKAVIVFQKLNALEQTGSVDRATQAAMFSEGAIKSDNPARPSGYISEVLGVTDHPEKGYVLKISVSNQKVYAYGWSAQTSDYTILVRVMICSTGLKRTPTPAGTYSAGGPVARWGYFPKWGVYAQYLFRIKGPYLFHSVLYRTANENSLIKSSLNNLGNRASHGCVRLKVPDAKWIYSNCAAGTTVIVS